MSKIKTLLLLISLLTPFSSAYAATKMVDKNSGQEAVLLELADLKVIEAYRILAEYYSLRVADKKYVKPSILWSIQAAEVGNTKSIYQLAKYTREFEQFKKPFSGAYIKQAGLSGKLQQETLNLIAIAAILGNPYAKTDLVMFPKLTSVTYKQVNMATKEALLRLKKGKLINCKLYVCNYPATHSVPPGILTKYQFALQQHTQQAKRLKCKSLQQCHSARLNSLVFLTPTKVNKYKEVAATENAPKIRKNQRLTKEAVNKTAANWDQQSNDDRNNKRMQAARKAVAYHAAADKEKLKSKIIELLDKMNLHRAADNQVTLADIMNILAQP
ncbi:MAG: hypothetical protein GQ582_01320 [Methyloprofundus sp.]|nr:hypothetical protein [Methyloprofundus sp.]